ncbi:hypothetical protein Q5H93_19055 [Hymenobacter sp. ASUV-10]|uniref:Uncharacterized protein n=1 Tax=Hymenobacter aranciens TaxID=3063996 RepID=A0ABT9BIL7_9BACT|nr:hypothetical protein [Hymenobacter sp. ASUV-10]MDO7876852.1 hypothetical protein [Hymenobacter sp. ASUV-10]
MKNDEDDFLKMAEGEHTFLLGDGAPLGNAVPRLQKAITELGLRIGAARQQGQGQKPGTATITQTRDELKTATIRPASVLRRQIGLVCTDALVLQALKPTVKDMEKGPDKDYLDYLQVLVDTPPTLDAKALQEVGYDETVRDGLATQLETLQNTAGATRQQQSKQTTATAQFGPALTAVREWLDKELDPLVEGQELAFPKLVTRYLELRRIQHTAGARRPKVLRGTTHFGIPEVVIRRDKVTIAAGTLRNKSGKGTLLRYYLADTPDALPTDGRGRVVKYRESPYIADLSTLGPDPNAPFLLVLQERQGGPGEYRLEYTPSGDTI